MIRIRAVLFDFDGTLTEPGSLDFDVIRDAIRCPTGRPVLEFIRNLESEADRTHASEILDRFEAEAARLSVPNEGAEELLAFLKVRSLKMGIISRNSLTSIRTALQNFKQAVPSDFEIILSRDDPYSPKPSPEGILAAAGSLGIPVSEVLVVGDFVFDIEAGRKAGALTAFLSNRGAASCSIASDFTVETLSELKQVIRCHIPLPAGKLPIDLLGDFLEETSRDDSSVLIPPGIGEDAAALEIGGSEILVLKSDPITFETGRPGQYAVAVNANDIAAMGASPRWLLPCLLFPVGVTAAQIRDTMRDLETVARAHGMVICGGHTEITDGVTRPIIAAQAAGTVSRTRLINKKKMQEGDRILLTKALAVEGTSILARTCADRLRSSGLDETKIRRCEDLAVEPGISIVREANIASGNGNVTALHDVTEGGLAAAVTELSAAGRHRIRIFFERIPVYPETAEICRLLGIDPLGLIGSGSLLICCRPEAGKALIKKLQSAGIRAVEIGAVLEPGTGVEAVDAFGTNIPWPAFDTDELARLISGK